MWACLASFLPVYFQSPRFSLCARVPTKYRGCHSSNGARLSILWVWGKPHTPPLVVHMAARFAPQYYTNLRLRPASPRPALASPDSARSSRTTRGWGERRGAGDALAEIDAVDGSAENRNRRARRGRAAQSPHPVPGERSATVRGHKPHRQRHTVSHGRGRATLHLQHPSVTHRASVVRDIRYRRHPAAVGVRFASRSDRPIARGPAAPQRRARGDQSVSDVEVPTSHGAVVWRYTQSSAELRTTKFATIGSDSNAMLW